MADKTGVEIRWGGEVYGAGQLTAADMIAMEDEFGLPFGEIELGSIKAACWIVWLVRRHDDPDIKFEDVTAITLNQLATDAETEAQVGRPPTSPTRKRAKRSAASGTRS